MVDRTASSWFITVRMEAFIVSLLIIAFYGGFSFQDKHGRDTSALEDASVEMIRLHFVDRWQIIVREDGDDFVIQDMAQRILQRIENNLIIPVEVNNHQFRDFYCKVYFLDSADQIL